MPLPPLPSSSSPSSPSSSSSLPGRLLLLLREPPPLRVPPSGPQKTSPLPPPRRRGRPRRARGRGPGWRFFWGGFGYGFFQGGGRELSKKKGDDIGDEVPRLYFSFPCRVLVQRRASAERAYRDFGSRTDFTMLRGLRGGVKKEHLPFIDHAPVAGSGAVCGPCFFRRFFLFQFRCV